MKEIERLLTIIIKEKMVKEKPQEELKQTQEEEKKFVDPDEIGEIPLGRQESKMTVESKSENSNDSHESIIEEDKEVPVKEEKQEIQIHPINFSLDFSMGNLSIYLQEETEQHFIKKDFEIKKVPSNHIIDLQLNENQEEEKKYSSKIITHRPILILNLSKLTGLMYKPAPEEMKIKLQIMNALMIDNTLDLAVLYSSDTDFTEPMHNNRRHTFSYTNLLKVPEITDEFLNDCPEKVVFYKEENMKGLPLINATISIIDNTLQSQHNKNDADSEITISFELNGLVIRPEFHTDIINNLITQLVKNIPSLSKPNNVPIKKEFDIGQSQAPKRNSNQNSYPIPDVNLLLKLNCCVRNLTLDIWPVLPLSILESNDPCKCIVAEEMNKQQKYRCRQRMLLLFDKIDAKVVSAAFIQQEKIDACIDDMRLVVLDISDISREYNPILLLDKTTALNSAFSLIRKLGFTDICTLDKIVIHLNSQPKKEDPLGKIDSQPKQPAKRLEIQTSTLAFSLCYDSLACAIKMANSIIAGIDELQRMAFLHLRGEDNKEVHVEKQEIVKQENYEIKRQTSMEASALARAMQTVEEVKKDDVLQDFEIVQQERRGEEINPLRKEEHIDTAAMKAAFEQMDLNPDYMSTHEENNKKSGTNIEGDVLIKRHAEANVAIAKNIDIVTDYVTQPKRICQQYELEYHLLPNDYPAPVLTVLVSFNKFALVLFEGQDFCFLDSSVHEEQKSK